MGAFGCTLKRANWTAAENNVKRGGAVAKEKYVDWIKIVAEEIVNRLATLEHVN